MISYEIVHQEITDLQPSDDSPSACLVHEKILTEDKILIKQRDQSLKPSEDAV